jgi:hypothetical protein
MDKCQQCQDWEIREETGSWPTPAAFTRWSMWGCCCDPASSADKQAYIKAYTA